MHNVHWTCLSCMSHCWCLSEKAKIWWQKSGGENLASEWASEWGNVLAVSDLCKNEAQLGGSGHVFLDQQIIWPMIIWSMIWSQNTWSKNVWSYDQRTAGYLIFKQCLDFVWKMSPRCDCALIDHKRPKRQFFEEKAAKVQINQAHIIFRLVDWLIYQSMIYWLSNQLINHLIFRRTFPQKRTFCLHKSNFI